MQEKIQAIQTGIIAIRRIPLIERRLNLLFEERGLIQPRTS
jgi:hypothetical protein